MRRDSNDDLIQCHCVDLVTREPDIDFVCNECRGVGYLWDEELVVGYKVPLTAVDSSRARNLEKRNPGEFDITSMCFYFEYLTAPRMEDRIILIQLDLEGDPVLPYNRLKSYEINMIYGARSDRGRVEYWACYSHDENMKTLAGLP
jgi:hypothetical protein